MLFSKHWLQSTIALFLVTLPFSSTAYSQENTDVEPASPAPVATPAEKPWDFGWGALPALNYNADDGFGFGAVGSLFWYDEKTKPYRLATNFQIFMTTKLLQSHYLSVDYLNVADLPLRLTARVGYRESSSQNFCGFGNDVSCDPALAEQEANRLNLVDTEREDFLRHFYQVRFINVFSWINARWNLQHHDRERIDLLAGWRGYLYIPGSLLDGDGDGKADLSPYPDSFYQKTFPEGEAGFASVLSVGAVYDTRDHEPAPTIGQFTEFSLRGAAPIIGSTWTWLGANLTTRFFTPLNKERNLVLASRLVLDGIVGDPPAFELARLNSSVGDYFTFGGSDMGRGIRVQRYLGRMNVLTQHELRWRFAEFDAGTQHFGFVAKGFFDAGATGKDWDDWGNEPYRINAGFGGGLNVEWNRNFIVRVDVATSAIENFGVSPYITIGNVF